MKRPSKFKRKFRVTATMDVTFVVWADSAEQVERALDEAEPDDIFNDVSPEIRVEDASAAKQVHSAVVLTHEDDPPEWVNLAEMPWEPVEDPKLDDDYVPTPEDLEAAGQTRMEGV